MTVIEKRLVNILQAACSTFALPFSLPQQTQTILANVFATLCHHSQLQMTHTHQKKSEPFPQTEARENGQKLIKIKTSFQQETMEQM